MKRKITLLMTALMLAAIPNSAVMASEDADAIIVEDETESVSVESEDTDAETSEEEKNEMLIEAVEEVSEEEPAAVQEAEDEPAAITSSGTCGDNVSWTFSDDGILTISGTGKMATYGWCYNEDTKSEEEIPAPWAEFSNQIKQVVIKKGVTTISDYAFMNLSNLESVSIADSVKSIGITAFNGTALKEVTIPDSVTSLGEAAFAGCTKLKTVVLSNRLTVISDSTFNWCTSLNNVVIPDSVQTIGAMAFCNCSSLTDVTIGSGVTCFEWYAFDGTPWLEKQDEFVIYNSVLLRYQGSDTSVTIPDGVTAVGGYAFYDCSSVTNAVIPEGVVSIGEYAFSCSGLKTVTVAKSVTSIEYAALGYGELATSYDITIYGYTGSAAETYAASDSHFTFVALDGGTVALAAGKISSLTNVAKGIKIKWSKVSGADGYYIYRKTGSGSYKKIKTITSASTVSYTDKKVADKNGTTYTYKVVPYSGSTEGTGSEKTTIRLTGTALTSVKNSAAGKAKVKWTAVSNVTGYQIEYSASSSFASSKTKTVSGATKKSKTLTGLTKGTTYYVRIRTYKTVNGTKYYSAWSSKQKVTITK